MVVSGVIEIGSIPIAITFNNPAFFRYFHQRYGNFFAAKLPKYNIFVEELPQIGNRSDKLLTHIEKNIVKFYTNFYLGSFDIARSIIKASVFLHPISFDNFLRTLLGMISINEKSVLIHGMGFVNSDYSFIVTGGWLDVRQQLSELIDRKMLLTDSLLLIKRKHEDFIAYSTPFNSDLKNNTLNISAPVKAILFSAKSDTTIIKDISKKEAIKKAYKLGFHVPCKRNSTSDYMNLIELLINSVETKSITLDIKNLDINSLLSIFGDIP